MSVLIKGMEMPTSCDECRLFVDYGCVPQNQWVNEEGTNKRLDNCPLIELPPHGRLIDADALIDDGWLLVKSRPYIEYTPTAICYDSNMVTKRIADVPTILEAEVEE